jgi:hypothetical protein
MYSVHYNGTTHPTNNLPDRKAVEKCVQDGLRTAENSMDGCPVCVKQNGKEVACVKGTGKIVWIVD